MDEGFIVALILLWQQEYKYGTKMFRFKNKPSSTIYMVPVIQLSFSVEENVSPIFFKVAKGCVLRCLGKLGME